MAICYLFRGPTSSIVVVVAIGYLSPLWSDKGYSGAAQIKSTTDSSADSRYHTTISQRPSQLPSKRPLTCGWPSITSWYVKTACKSLPSQELRQKMRTGHFTIAIEYCNQWYRLFHASRAGRCYCRVGVRSHIVHHPLIMYSVVFVHGLQGHPRDTWAWDRPAQLAPRVPGGTAGHSHLLKKIFSRRQRTGLEGTHKPEVDGVYWPLDFLAKDCVNSRILTWGYESKVSNFFGGAANQSNIRAHAQNLLRALMVERLNSVSSRFTVHIRLLNSPTARETHYLYCTFFWW